MWAPLFPPLARPSPLYSPALLARKRSKKKINSQTIPLLILILLITPLIPLVNADESTDNTLEARDISATFSNEYVELSWRNIQTSNTSLLDDLHMSTYEVLRHTQPITFDIVNSLQPIITGIEACSIGDNNAMCSGKNHTISLTPPEGTDGVFHYGVVTVLPNGSRTTSLNPGLSQILTGLVETVADHWGPTNLQGVYDTATKSTTLTWDNAVNGGNNHQIWVWRHSEEATRENWESLSKTSVAVIFDAVAETWTGTISGEVERDAWYSITYDNGTFSDTRFLRDNTLSSPIREDNIAPDLRGEVTAIFQPFSGVTQLFWDGASIAEYSINIYRSPSQIVNLNNNDVTKITSIMGTATTFEYIVPFGEFGNFWYAVTLVDELGNEIDILSSYHPVSEAIFENTIADESLTVPTNIQVEQYLNPGQIAMIEISWTDSEVISNATYHIWRSSKGEIIQADIDEHPSLIDGVEYVGNASSGEPGILLPLPQNIDRQSWYAITVEGHFGSSQSQYNHSTIISGVNSMNTSIHEDTTPPSFVTDLEANVNGSTNSVELQWTNVDDVVQWEVWYAANISVSEFPLGKIGEETGWTLHEMINSSQTQSIYESQILFTNITNVYSVFAVFGIDEMGNHEENVSNLGMVEAKYLDFEISNISVNVQISSLGMVISERELSNGEVIVLGAWEQGTEVGMGIYGLENLTKISVAYHTECGDVGDLEENCEWQELPANPAVWHLTVTHTLPSTGFIGSETMYILYEDHFQNKGLVGLSYTVFVSQNQEIERENNSEIDDSPSTQSTTQDMTGLIVILVIVGLMALIRIINEIESKKNLAPSTPSSSTLSTPSSSTTTSPPTTSPSPSSDSSLSNNGNNGNNDQKDNNGPKGKNDQLITDSDPHEEKKDEEEE